MYLALASLGGLAVAAVIVAVILASVNLEQTFDLTAVVDSILPIGKAE